MSRPSTFKRHGFGWVTLTLFVCSLSAHFVLSLATGNSVTEWARDFAENIQSEMAQLLLQVVGLAYLFQVGSPSSKEAGERIEAKIDAILANTARDGTDLIQCLDREFLRK